MPAGSWRAQQDALNDRVACSPVGMQVCLTVAGQARLPASVAKKVLGRTGAVVGHSAMYGLPVVEFPAIGRKKAVRLPPSATFQTDFVAQASDAN